MKSLHEELKTLPDDKGIDKLGELLQSFININDILELKNGAAVAVEELIARFSRDKRHLCQVFTDKCDARIKELEEISSILNEDDN